MIQALKLFRFEVLQISSHLGMEAHNLPRLLPLSYLPFMASLLVCCGLLMLFPQAGACREAGWVPLEKGTGLEKQKLPAASLPRHKAAQSKSAPAKKEIKPADLKPLPEGVSVYDGQPPVNEAELYQFLELLPQFRAWSRSHGEEAHPMLNKQGKPDFLYSPAAAQWVGGKGFAPARFFCVMGKMAAALAIVEEGNDSASSRPADMPQVDGKELALARKHLGELLSAGGPPQPIK